MNKSSLQLNITVESVKIILYYIIDDKTEINNRKIDASLELI